MYRTGVTGKARQTVNLHAGNMTRRFCHTLLTACYLGAIPLVDKVPYQDTRPDQCITGLFIGEKALSLTLK